MNWFLTIVAGGLAGWIAEKIMKFDTGLIMNVVLGITGAIVANFLLNAIGIALLGGGFIDYVIRGVIGACILIFGYRMFMAR